MWLKMKCHTYLLGGWFSVFLSGKTPTHFRGISPSRRAEPCYGFTGATFSTRKAISKGGFRNCHNWAHGTVPFFPFFFSLFFSGKGYTVEHIFLKTWGRKLIEYDFFKFPDRYLSGKCHSSICTLQKLFPKHNCFPVPVNLNKTSSSTIQSRRFRAFNGIHAFTIWR